MSRNACNGENGETGKKLPAAGDLNWMPKVAPWRLAILASGHISSTGQNTIPWITRLVFIVIIHWISIYPVDRAIELLNNWGQSLVPSVAPAISYKYNQHFGMSMSANERYYSFTQLGRRVCLCVNQ